MDEAWSPPDGEGIETLRLDVGAASTLRGRRRRRGAAAHPEVVTTWPEGWRALLARWIKGGERRRWATLVGVAGPRRTAVATRLLDALLRGGLAEVEEARRPGGWEVRWVRFTAGSATRRLLGLPDRAAEAQAWADAAAAPLADPRLTAARASLDVLRPATALRRLDLLRALDRWLAEERFGTRRDFALLARGHTKSVTPAEWRWLAEACDLAALGIEGHTPALWLRVPFTLHAPQGALAMAAVPDAIGLTPATVATVAKIEGTIDGWRLIENRTSFEHAARRYGATSAVVWLPGYPSPWWHKAVTHLLALAPAPAWIACDPDPAGIQICLHAARPWQEVGLPWHPWHMEAATLDALPCRLPLTDHDRLLLDRLAQETLPPELEGLAEAMGWRGVKGEQEGLVL